MFQTNLVPGQGFLPCVVFEKTSAIAPSGRPVTGVYKRTDKTFFAIKTAASQQEVDQWKQQGHPITHKLVQYGGMVVAKATDYIHIDGEGDFYVQGSKNPGGLHVTHIYYVEERLDLKKELV